MSPPFTFSETFNLQPEISILPVLSELRANWAGVRYRIGMFNDPDFKPVISKIYLPDDSCTSIDDQFMFEIGVLDLGVTNVLEIINACKYLLDDNIAISIVLPTLVPLGKVLIQAIIHVSISKNGIGPTFITTFENCVNFSKGIKRTAGSTQEEYYEDVSLYLYDSLEKERVCKTFDNISNNDYALILGEFSLNLCGNASSALKSTEINKIIEDYNLQ